MISNLEFEIKGKKVTLFSVGGFIFNIQVKKATESEIYGTEIVTGKLMCFDRSLIVAIQVND